MIKYPSNLLLYLFMWIWNNGPIKMLNIEAVARVMYKALIIF